MNETFYFCENCKEFFERKEILIENGGLHCPHCGGPVKQAANFGRTNTISRPLYVGID
jgi:DNA-directed RNA polymerase subunit RPC12/RpoP